MREEAAAALDAIRAVYGAEVRYTGAGLTSGPIVAIRSDSMPRAFQGLSGDPGRLWFEIQKQDLPERPLKGNLIVEAATEDRWRVIDVDEAQSDVAAWILFVETAGPA
jgi:hypothetical protein